MNENIVNNKNFFKIITEFLKTNIKVISIILFLFLLTFISFQIYTFYLNSKIKKDSISFFQVQNVKDISVEKNTILELSNNNNFTNGTIKAISLSAMKGGAGHTLIYNIETDDFTGYGQ